MEYIGETLNPLVDCLLLTESLKKGRLINLFTPLFSSSCFVLRHYADDHHSNL